MNLGGKVERACIGSCIKEMLMYFSDSYCARLVLSLVSSLATPMKFI